LRCYSKAKEASLAEARQGAVSPNPKPEARAPGEFDKVGRAARVAAAAAALAGVRAHGAALQALAETGVLEQVYLAQGKNLMKSHQIESTSCQIEPCLVEPESISDCTLINKYTTHAIEPNHRHRVKRTSQQLAPESQAPPWGASCGRCGSRPWRSSTAERRRSRRCRSRSP